MDTAQVLLEEAMQWLQAHYTDFRFTVERDVVWTLQRHIALRIEKEQLPLAVFNDYPLIAGTRRSKSTDLALLASPFVLPVQSVTGKWGASSPVEVAVEFKYEPAHLRKGIDIWPTKLPVVAWSSVQEDVTRVHEFVALRRARVAYAILLDEGGFFRRRLALAPGVWHDWNNGVSVHWMLVSAPLASEERGW